MAFTDIVVEITADLRPLERKLAEAKRLIAQQIQASSAIPVGDGRGRRGTSSGAASAGLPDAPDPFRASRIIADRQKAADALVAKATAARDAGFRQLESARAAADVESRRRAAAQEASRRDAERDLERRRAAVAARVTAARRGAETAVGAATAEFREFVAGAGRGGVGTPAQGVEAATRRAGAALRQNVVTSGLFQANLRAARREMQGLVDQLHLAGRLTAAGLVAGFGTLVKSGIEINRQFQEQQFGLAAVLQTTTKLVDVRTGQALTGRAETEFNLRDAARLRGLARRSAAASPVTGRELFTAFSSNVGLGRQLGLNETQTLEATKIITSLAKAQGLTGERQFAQETRAIFTGDQLQSGTVARVLGITSKKQIDAIRAAKDPAREFFKILENAKPILDEFARSFSGLATTLTTKFEDFRQQAFERVFDKITLRLGGLNAALTDTKISEFANRFGDALVDVFDRVEAVASSAAFRGFVRLLGFAADNAKALALAFGAVKAARLGLAATTGLANLAEGLRQTAVARAAATGGGGAVAAPSGGLATVAGGAAALTATVVAVVSSALVGAAIGSLIERQIERLRGDDVEREAERRLAEVRGGRTGTDNPEAARRTARAAGLRLQAQADLREAQRLAGEAVSPTSRRPTVGQAVDLARQQVVSSATLGFVPVPGAPEFGTRASPAARAAALRRIAQERIEEAARIQREGDVERVSRQLKNSAANDEKERRRRATEDVFFKRTRASLTDDKVTQLRLEGQAEEAVIRKSLRDRARQEQLITLSRRETTRKIREALADEAAAERQTLAEVTGNRLLANRNDLAATLERIRRLQRVPAERRAALAQAATEQAGRRDATLQIEAPLSRGQFLADASGSERRQLRISATRKVLDEVNRLEEDATLTRGQRERAEALAVAATRRQVAREDLEKVRELRLREQEVGTRVFETFRSQAEARRKLTRDLDEADRKTALQGRDLAVERLRVERDLTRAVEDRAVAVQRVGEVTKDVFGRERTALGLEGEQLALRGDATSALAAAGITEEGIKFGRIGRRGPGGLQTTPELAAAEAAAGIRELRDLLLRPEAGGELGQTVQDLGLRLLPSQQTALAQAQQALGARTLGLQTRGAVLGESEEEQSLRRRRADIGLPVEEATRAKQDVTERIDELPRTLAETRRELAENFNKQVRENGVALAELGQQVVRLAQQFSANGLALQKDLLPALRQAARFASLTAAQGQAARDAEPTRQIIFQSGAVQVQGLRPDDLVDYLERQARLLGPRRR